MWEVGRGEDLCLRKARVDCGSEEEAGILGRTGWVSHVPCAFRNNPGETRALSRSPHAPRVHPPLFQPLFHPEFSQQPRERGENQLSPQVTSAERAGDFAARGAGFDPRTPHCCSRSAASALAASVQDGRQRGLSTGKAGGGGEQTVRELTRCHPVFWAARQDCGWTLRPP